VRLRGPVVEGWVRFALVMSVILLDAIYEEARVLGAEFMMLLRWSRDVIRYDFRWIVQEKLRLMWRQRRS
jgi:hypothetical protein